MTYLIALDLDGTLLNNQSKLSEKTIEGIKHLSLLGHPIVIATGRPFIAAIHFYHQLALTSPMITDNGGTVTHPLDTSFKAHSSTLPISVIQSILREAKPYIYSAYYTIGDSIYAYQYKVELEMLFNGVLSKHQHVIDENTVKVAPTGMIFMIENTHITTFENLLHKHQESINFRFWGSHQDYAFYELYHPNISKWTGLQYVADHYGIPHDKIIAFGDDVNDIDMLKNAYLGVKMKNHRSALDDLNLIKTTHTNDQDGVVRFLFDYFKIK